LTTAIWLAGCVGRPSKNLDCQWPANHPLSSLDLTASSDARHLADDAQIAEDRGIGFLAGGIWFGLTESVRVGNGHMSYRVERLPIRRNGLAMFTAHAALFAAVSAVQYRKRRS
jgi:hypothetical protein